MKVNVPELETLRRDGVKVVHVHCVHAAPELTAVLALLGFGLLALAVVLAEGSKVAGWKGGHRVR